MIWINHMNGAAVTTYSLERRNFAKLPAINSGTVLGPRKNITHRSVNMRTLYLLPFLLSLGFGAALLPIHADTSGVVLSYAAAHADGEKKKDEKGKKSENMKKGTEDKECSKDQPCNDANENRKDADKDKEKSKKEKDKDKSKKDKDDKGKKDKGDKDKKDKKKSG